MKKIIPGALAALLFCFALTGCGGDRDPILPSPTPATSATPGLTPTPSPSTLPEVTDELLPDPENGEVRDEDGVITDDDSGARRDDAATNGGTGAANGAASGTNGASNTSRGKIGGMMGGRSK